LVVPLANLLLFSSSIRKDGSHKETGDRKVEQPNNSASAFLGQGLIFTLREERALCFGPVQMCFGVVGASRFFFWHEISADFACVVF
jgi:hypothetical protein